MRVGRDKSHLTYCLNVHPAETWEDTFESIKTYPTQIRDVAAPGAPFGLGLRISNIASLSLEDMKVISELKDFLKQEDLYVFTINGFPYGPFHGETVKQDVYKPDWRTEERVNYTLRLADILAEILPKGMSGSISTVPCSYKAWIENDDDVRIMVDNLVKCANYLDELEQRTGRNIHIGLEPEPDCYIETTNEVIEFFGRSELQDSKVRNRIGVCFDTCHLAVEYEDLEDSLQRIVDAGIKISKIQISSAVKREVNDGCENAVMKFNDAVYLHQVKVRAETGEIHSQPDLPEFVKTMAGAGDCRVHCHVPLYFEGNDDVCSTSSELTGSFFNKVMEYGFEHLEIETYTFDVLPDELKARGIVGSIIDEYKWVLERISK